MLRYRISCTLYSRNIENFPNDWKYSNWLVIWYWHLVYHRFISIKTSEELQLSATFECITDQTCAPADDPLDRKLPISWFIIGWHYYRLANGREMAAVTTRRSAEVLRFPWQRERFLAQDTLFEHPWTMALFAVQRYPLSRPMLLGFPPFDLKLVFVLHPWSL